MRKVLLYLCIIAAGAAVLAGIFRAGGRSTPRRAAETRPAPCTETASAMRPVTGEAAVGWTVIPDNTPGPTGFTVMLRLPPVTIRQAEGGVVVEAEGQVPPQDGTPALPAFARLFSGRPGYSLRVADVTASYTTVATGVVVITAGAHAHLQQGHHEAEPGAFIPASAVQVEEAWHGTQKLARVAVYPVRYYPQSKELTAAAEMEVRLLFAPSERPESARGPL